MTTLHSTDTRAEIERLQRELMRSAPAWRKLELVGQLFEGMKWLLTASPT